MTYTCTHVCTNWSTVTCTSAGPCGHACACVCTQKLWECACVCTHKRVCSMCSQGGTQLGAHLDAQAWPHLAPAGFSAGS